MKAHLFKYSTKLTDTLGMSDKICTLFTFKYILIIIQINNIYLICRMLIYLKGISC